MKKLPCPDDGPQPQAPSPAARARCLKVRYRTPSGLDIPAARCRLRFVSYLPFARCPCALRSARVTRGLHPRRRSRPPRRATGPEVRPARAQPGASNSARLYRPSAWVSHHMRNIQPSIHRASPEHGPSMGRVWTAYGWTVDRTPAQGAGRRQQRRGDAQLQKLPGVYPWSTTSRSADSRQAAAGRITNRAADAPMRNTAANPDASIPRAARPFLFYSKAPRQVHSRATSGGVIGPTPARLRRAHGRLP